MTTHDRRATRTLSITIDTEVDKSPDWSISSPATFRSVTEAIPHVLTPIFRRYGARPTYLLSPEVIEEPTCAEALVRLGGEAELGTHLHPDFIEPLRRLRPGDMGGRRGDGIQKQLDRSSEAEKLANLTDLFGTTFGCRPRVFRAGRFGRSQHTLDLLVELGYLVDSSVTPGLRWRYPEGEVDYRREPMGPHWVQCDAGAILEAPVSIWPAGPFAPLLTTLPRPLESISRKLVPRWGAYNWLRPSWGPPGRLADLASRAPDCHLVVMFHSMEVVPGASPYASDQAAADRVVGRLDHLLASWVRSGHEFCTLSELADRCRTVAG